MKLYSRKLLIAGGGIGGMSAALALLRAGFDVEVYEQASELREIGAGVQISPNGSRVLQSLGVFDLLQTMSCTPTGKVIRHWKTGKTWPLFDLEKMALNKYGISYLTVYRPDLLKVLTDAVRDINPNALVLGARCEGVEQDGSNIWLRLQNGRMVRGDVLVGADGIHSNIRNSLFSDGDPEYTGLLAYRATLPIERVPAQISRTIGTNWVGPGGHVTHYFVQGGKILNFVGTREVPNWIASGWRSEVTTKECINEFAGWHSDVVALIEQVPTFVKWAFLDRPFLSHWSSGRATLLGDACHPTLPTLSQGVNMAIEDGVVLARCLQSYDDVQFALARYEELRMERTYRIVRAAASFMPNNNHACLAEPEEAEAFIEKTWNSESIDERYDWLFKYNADQIAV